MSEIAIILSVVTGLIIVSVLVVHFFLSFMENRKKEKKIRETIAY